MLYYFSRDYTGTIDNKQTAVAFSFCLYPFVVLSLTALYKWWDDKCVASRFVVVALSTSQVCSWTWHF